LTKITRAFDAVLMQTTSTLF